MSTTEMAITDTEPTTATETAAVSAFAAPSTGGFAGLLGTGDHKSLGRLYVGFSLAFGAAAFVLAGLSGSVGISASLADTFTETSFQFFTLSRFSFVFLFLMPVFIGLGTAVVPLQVGASTIAFPRAAAAAFWTWLGSAIVLLTAYGVNGGVGGGSFDGQLLAFLALIGLVASLLLAAVCIATTAVALRSPGMTLDRVPLFSWSMIVATAAWLITLPVFVANVLMVFVDAKYGNPSGFGSDAAQWPQLSWIVAQPQIFAFAIPALGVIADIGATFSRTRLPQRGVTMGAIGAFGAFSIGAWAQPAHIDNVWHSWMLLGQSAVIVIPLLMVFGGIAMAMRKGPRKLGGPALLSLVSLLMLMLGAAAAAPVAIGRLGLFQTPNAIDELQAIRSASGGSIDSTLPVYAWGQMGIVIVAAAAAAIAGIYYWGPKLTGRKLGDGVAKLLAPLFLLGTLLFGVPMLVLGFASKFESIGDQKSALFGAAVAGAGLVTFCLLLASVGTLVATYAFASRGEAADDDAWGFGQTLEWACASPPPTGNFGELPVVTSPEPLLDLVDGKDD